MSDIFPFPPIFHSGLSRFKLSFLYTKYVFRNQSRRCYDDTLAFTVTSSNSQVVLMLRTDLRIIIGEVIYEFLCHNIPTFRLFALNGFDFTFLLPIYIGHIENVSRIRRCDNLGLSCLHFKLSLQSAICILYLVCILNPICNLQSAFHTDR